jgi:hypothetical protein
MTRERANGAGELSSPFDEYRDTPLWRAVEETIAELVATRELQVDTAPEYVIGYLCRELTAKRIVVVAALQRPA